MGNVSDFVNLHPTTFERLGHLECQPFKKTPEDIPPLLALKLSRIANTEDADANINEWTTSEHDTSCDVNVHHEVASNGSDTLEKAPLEQERGVISNGICMLGQG